MSLHMVVLGDSVMWGQGLLEEHKFHTQLKHHLAALTQMEVIEHVYAHSGATIWPKESADGNTPLWGEVPVAFPSITAQLVRAKRETNTLRTVLVLVNGGINDVELVNIVHPAATPTSFTPWCKREWGGWGRWSRTSWGPSTTPSSWCRATSTSSRNSPTRCW